MARVLASEVTEERPPMGRRYIWGHFGRLGPNQQVTIKAYDPRTRSAEVEGDTWVDLASLRDRPATAAETKATEQAQAIAKARRERDEAIAKAAQAKQQREDARQERERLRIEARQARERLRKEVIEGEKDRRAFAKQLRENYLATGADIKVSVSGPYAQRLSLEYPLINDVWLYQFQHNGEVMEVLKAKGFTQLSLSDGWNYAKRLTFN